LLAKSITAPPDANHFYRDLIQRQGLVHKGLNGYVYPLLRHRRWLPERFVRDVFLPVPNPETQFHYGALKAGEQLQIQFAAGLLNTHEIFFSLYNRYCFPLDWYPIADETYLTKPCDRKSVFIIRIHPRRREVTFPSEPVRLTPIKVL
jgi:hypothetical protein